MKIGQAVTIVRILVAVIPAVRTLIDFIEQPGYGKEKKEAVMNAIEKILDAFDLSDTIKTTILGIVDILIDIKIQVMNLNKPESLENKAILDHPEYGRVYTTTEK